MNSSVTLPSHTPPRDPDLAEQARPGHGVPSQDPDPAAQIPLEPEEAEREAKSVLTGGGMVGAAGAAMNPADSSSADPALEDNAPANTGHDAIADNEKP